MAFLESELATFFYNVILTLLMVVGFKILLKSAQDSLTRTGGKWSSVFDEGVIGVVGICIVIIMWNMGPVGLINVVTKLIEFAWNLIRPILRNLGFPV